MFNLTESLEGKDYQLEQPAKLPPYLTVSLVTSSLGAAVGILLVRGAEQVVHVVDAACKSAFLFVTYINQGPVYNPHLVTAESTVIPALVVVGVSASVGLIRDLRS